MVFFLSVIIADEQDPFTVSVYGQIAGHAQSIENRHALIGYGNGSRLCHLAEYRDFEVHEINRHQRIFGIYGYFFLQHFGQFMPCHAHDLYASQHRIVYIPFRIDQIRLQHRRCGNLIHSRL